MASSNINNNFNLNLNGEDNNNYHDNIHTPQHFDKVPMFEKPLTPSDVGKLNRLVIPKQHAEKYFPLGGGQDDKGLLLSFEDESGKCWRFRYSYWNSSKSYVLTKGWSRYVKDKKLDAGDVVFFARDKDDRERLFIGWRRRRSSEDGGGGGWSNGLLHSGGHSYPISGGYGVTSHVPYQHDCLHAAVLQNERRYSSKTVRLFGVNLECQPEVSETEPDGGASLSEEEDPAAKYHHLFYSPIV